MSQIVKRCLGAAFAIAVCVVTGALAARADSPASARQSPVQYLFELTAVDAEAAISRALEEKGAGSRVLATISGKKSQTLYSNSRPVTVEVRGLRFNPDDRSWNASLLFNADDVVVSAMPVAGRFAEMMDMPVLKRAVRNGEIIGENDIELKAFPASRSRGLMIEDKTALVGKSPVRGISPARPIRKEEIAEPAVLRKNAIVQMRYMAPGIEITTTGQALESGARGEVVPVRNLASKSVVRAVVENESVVGVLPPAAQVSQTSQSTPYVAN